MRGEASVVSLERRSPEWAADSAARQRASGGWFVSTCTVMSPPGTAFSLPIYRTKMLFDS